MKDSPMKESESVLNSDTVSSTDSEESKLTNQSAMLSSAGPAVIISPVLEESILVSTAPPPDSESSTLKRPFDSSSAVASHVPESKVARLETVPVSGQLPSVESLPSIPSVASSGADSTNRSRLQDLIVRLNTFMQHQSSATLAFIHTTNCIEQCPSVHQFWQQCCDLDKLLTGTNQISDSFLQDQGAVIQFGYSVKNFQSLINQFQQLFDQLSSLDANCYHNPSNELVAWLENMLNPINHTSKMLWAACLSGAGCGFIFRRIQMALAAMLRVDPSVALDSGVNQVQLSAQSTLVLNHVLISSVTFTRNLRVLFTEKFQDSLQILINLELIDAADVFEKPTLEILGGDCETMQFVGRSIDSIVGSISQNLITSNLGRCDLIFVNGCAGVGKTRYLVEVCNSDKLENTLKFAITFNNNTELTQLDQFLFSNADTSHIALSLRLLYVYARRKGDALFGNWCNAIFQSGIIPRLADLHPVYVINWLVEQIVSKQRRIIKKTTQGKFPVLVVVDESLMAWNFFLDGNSSIPNNTWNMLRSLYKLQGFMPDRKFSMCVVFSALNNRPFLREGGSSPSSFPIKHFNLDPIQNVDAVKVLKRYFQKHPEHNSLISSFHMTLHAFVTQIVQCVGTLSRALEFVICVCENSNEHPIYHFRDLVFRVSQRIASRYSLPTIYTDQLLAETLLGLPIQRDTALYLLRQSFVCETQQLDGVPSVPPNDNEGIVVKFNTAHLLSYAINLVSRRNVGTSEQIDLFHSILVETFEAIAESHSAHNIFEEVYRYRLFLQMHYLQMFHSRSSEVLNATTIFSPCLSKIVHGSCNFSIDWDVQMFESQIKSWNPISAQNCKFKKNEGSGSKDYHFLNAPADPLEPAVDTILYLRQAFSLIVYGVQLKFSTLRSTPVDMRSLKKASLAFFNRMTFLGHNHDNLVFVAILRQKLPDYMSDPSDPRYQDFYFGLGSVILICNSTDHDHVEEHLGPTLSSLLTQFYTYTRSDSCKLATDVLVRHNDDSSLFHDADWKKFSITAKAKYASNVLVEAVYKLTNTMLSTHAELEQFLTLDWNGLGECEIAIIILAAIQFIRDSGFQLESTFKLLMANAESTSIKLGNYFSLTGNVDS